ncbi:unnamed protein product [Chrysoparadoxa australica]
MQALLQVDGAAGYPARESRGVELETGEARSSEGKIFDPGERCDLAPSQLHRTAHLQSENAVARLWKRSSTSSKSLRGNGMTAKEPSIEIEVSSSNSKTMSRSSSSSRESSIEKATAATPPDHGYHARQSSAAGTSFDHQALHETRTSAENTSVLRLEQKIFLQAAFQLLEERGDGHGWGGGGEGGEERPLMRVGVLKKAHKRVAGLHSMQWKHKYVELRLGLFEYEDQSVVLGMGRTTKSILLHKGYCSCKMLEGSESPSSRRNRDSSLHMFEIASSEGSKNVRVWATPSREDCLRWVRLINKALVEKPPDPDDGEVTPEIPENSPYALDMLQYLSARGALRGALSPSEYLRGLEPIFCNRSRLRIPTRWVRQQLSGADRACLMESKQHGQLAKDMTRDTVCINGTTLPGEHGIAALVGSLTRCLLAQASKCSESDPLQRLTEAQGLLAARDVLLACNRTTSAGDVYMVVNHMCRNEGLAVLVPASPEASPLAVTVSLHQRGVDDLLDRALSVPSPAEEVDATPDAPPSSRKKFMPFRQSLRLRTPSKRAEVRTSPVCDLGSAAATLGPRSSFSRLRLITSIDAKTRPSSAESVRSSPGAPPAASPSAGKRLTLRGPKALRFGKANNVAVDDTPRRSPQRRPPGHRSLKSDPMVIAKASACLPHSDSPGTPLTVKTARARLEKQGKSFFSDSDSDSECRAATATFGSSRIQVICRACVSYKLFSSDPQDEEQGIYATVDAMFEQTFQIKRGCARTGTASVSLETEGGLCSLEYREPCTAAQTV